MNENQENRLQTLSGSNFEIAENEPNIKGWTIKDQDGRKIGEVDDLIFDAETFKVRYIVMDLEGNVLDLEPRNVLVPIGLVELDAKDDDVILPGVTADHLRALPRFDKDRLDRTTESEVVAAFKDMGNKPTGSGSGFYDQERFDEERAYRNRPATGKSIPIIEEQMKVGKKEVETGGARLRTRIVEKPVEKDVTLRQEHVKVERRPVDRPVTEADINAFKEGEVDIRERAEIPVVGKEARVVEEVRMSKEVEEREEKIHGTVRGTELKVDKLNPDPNLNRNVPPTTGTNPNVPPTGARNPNMPPNRNPGQMPNPNQNPNIDPNKDPNKDPNQPRLDPNDPLRKIK
ncbi:PRC and DUF2382 domain-containing protein [Adhaeribacter soli]|nr:PRC and DUF2382 domain-containing protein [Adhaeribacter soli]